MTSDEKENIYNLLKLSSSWVYGYKSPKFQEKDIDFDDDVIEFITPKKIEKAAINNSIQNEEIRDFETTKTDNTINSDLEKTNGKTNINSIIEKISQCRNCVLAKTKTNIVFGEGIQNPYVMVIGDGPGDEEDKTGKPFAGKAEQLLEKMLAAISLSYKTNCYLTNIVKCHPPMNRLPMIDEANACSGYLQSQIHLLKPKFILAMGRSSVQNLLKTNAGFNQLRGQWFEYKFGNSTIPLMATFHPNELLRDERLKAHAWQDLKKFKEKLITEIPNYAENFYTQK